MSSTQSKTFLPFPSFVTPPPSFLTVKFAERHAVEEAGVELRGAFLQVRQIRAAEPSHA